MNVVVGTYVGYLVISIGLTVWVARTLMKNGRVFLIDSFLENEKLADAVNHLLVVGFYLINAGYVTLALKYGEKPADLPQAIETLSTKVGQRSRGGVPIYDIRDLKKIVRREGISIAVVAVPLPSAQDVVNLVVASGIKAVLNFSPGTLQAPPHVKLKSVDLTVSLESLSFFLARGDSDEK